MIRSSIKWGLVLLVLAILIFSGLAQCTSSTRAGPLSPTPVEPRPTRTPTLTNIRTFTPIIAR
jgi:hypothetical protein